MDFLPKITQGKLYLVGGSVRDSFLKRQIKDFDYVLVGATLQSAKTDLADWDFIGKSFPVFQKRLIVDGKEIVIDIALARLERKTAVGSKGFEVDFSPSITLEQDLARRDLTINSMAIDVTNPDNLIDPFNGLDDLNKKILRHTSPAFSEDPLRVYRLARFASQLGFGVSQTTINFAKKLSKELRTLSRDRIREEFNKACGAPYPWRFLEILTLCDCQDIHFNAANYNKKILQELRMANIHPAFIAAEMLKTFTKNELQEFDSLVGVTTENYSALKIIRQITEINRATGILGVTKAEAVAWVNLLRLCRRSIFSFDDIKETIQIYLGNRGLFIFIEGRKVFEETKAGNFPGLSGQDLGMAIDNHLFNKMKTICSYDIPTSL